MLYTHTFYLIPSTKEYIYISRLDSANNRAQWNSFLFFVCVSAVPLPLFLFSHTRPSNLTNPIHLDLIQFPQSPNLNPRCVVRFCMHPCVRRTYQSVNSLILNEYKVIIRSPRFTLLYCKLCQEKFGFQWHMQQLYIYNMSYLDWDRL